MDSAAATGLLHATGLSGAGVRSGNLSERNGLRLRTGQSGESGRARRVRSAAAPDAPPHFPARPARPTPGAMALHMIKLVVGVETLDELQAWRAARAHPARDRVVHPRKKPQPAAPMEDGGAL